MKMFCQEWKTVFRLKLKWEIGNHEVPGGDVLGALEVED